jgi:hypothetical protein
MPKEGTESVGLAHGASHLPEVDVLSYNVEVKDNWESNRFNLPEQLRKAIPHLGEDETIWQCPMMQWFKA